MFWVISVYFNIRNTLPKSGTFLLGHPVYSNSQVGVRGTTICIVSYLRIRLVPFWQFLVILDDLGIAHVTSGKFSAVLQRIVHCQVQEMSLHINTRMHWAANSHTACLICCWTLHRSILPRLSQPIYIGYTWILPSHILRSPKWHPSSFSTKILWTLLNFPVSATCSTDFVHLHVIMLITLSEYYALLHSTNVVSSLSSPNIVFSSAPNSQHPQIGFFSSLQPKGHSNTWYAGHCILHSKYHNQLHNCHILKNNSVSWLH